MTLQASRFSTLFLAIALAGAAAPALAQDGPWTVQNALGDPDRLTLSGSFRARYESLGNQYRPGFTGGDQLVSLRTTLLAEVDLSPVTLVAELYDSRAYLGDRDSSVTDGEVNTLEFVQAHAAVDTGALFGGGDSTLRLGRFKLDVGSRRLVGSNSYRNTTNAFTGAAFDWSRGADRLSLFYTLPQRRTPSDTDSLLNNEQAVDQESGDQRFWGVWYGRSALRADAALEAYVFGLEERDAPGFATRDRDIVTVGGRLYRDPKPGALDFEFEGGWQDGTARRSTSAADLTDLDVKAYFLHAEVGYRLERPWSPRVAFEYDLGSGDKDSADGEYNRFDNLFGPRRSDFGPTGIYGALGRSNISSPGVRVEVAPDRRWDGFVFYRALWLDEPGDSFASTGVRDPAGAAGRFAGHQVEARARYWVVPRAVRLELTAATLINGRFLDDAANANHQGDVRYGAIELTTTF
jgi:hypothetical protein